MNTVLLQVRRVPPVLAIVLLWLLLTVPSIFIRGAHYEEGETIGLTRGAFEDGHWISPHLYGLRFVEQPALISWLLAGLAMLTGRIDLWTSRLPAVLSIVGGAVLLYAVVRRYASVGAAIFGAACFLVSPMILQKIVTAEPDSAVSTLLFAALVIWWLGFEAGRTTAPRWISIGAILSVTSLFKGPQPLAYFFLGVGTYLVLQRQWPEFGKLALVSIMPAMTTAAWYVAVFQPGDFQLWLGHSRIGAVPSFASYLWHVIRVSFFIAVESLPALVLVFLLLPFIWRRRPDKATEFTVVLLLYAGVCTCMLVLWPGANGRYAMPALLGIGTAAGIAFDRLRTTHPITVRSSLLITLALAVYGVAINCVAMPLYPDRFREKALQGQRIGRFVAGDRRLICVTPESMNRDLLVYVRSPIRVVPLDSLVHFQPPFWALMLPEQEQIYRAVRSDVSIRSRLELSPGRARLVEIR